MEELGGGFLIGMALGFIVMIAISLAVDPYGKAMREAFERGEVPVQCVGVDGYHWPGECPDA